LPGGPLISDRKKEDQKKENDDNDNNKKAPGCDVNEFMHFLFWIVYLQTGL